MLQWGLDFLGGLASFVSNPVDAVAGWTFDKVTAGIYEWLARGLALLIEWVWRVLDRGTTPRLTDDWFRSELAARIGVIALAVTIAMMLASAVQAALAGRPDQILDAVKEGVRAVVASAFTIAVIDLMVGLVDEASAAVWRGGRADLVTMLEQVVRVAASSESLASTFVGSLCLLLGFIGLIGITMSLLTRTALIYVAAALAPLVWSTSVLPVMRGASRRLVHLLVALILAKLAVVVTLVIAVKLGANPGGDPELGGSDVDAAAAVGTLLTGFVAFLVAALSPMVVYRLMPTVEGAVAAAGVVGGWGRSLVSLGQGVLLAKGAVGMAAASRSVAGQGGVRGASGAATGGRPGPGPISGGGHHGGSTSPASSPVAAGGGTGGKRGNRASARQGGENLPPLPDAGGDAHETGKEPAQGRTRQSTAASRSDAPNGRGTE